MNLVLTGPDWKFGDVLRLHSFDRKHEYLYMFVCRKPRFHMSNGEPNDRGFVALDLGAPDCSGCSGWRHDDFGNVSASFGGLPTEDAWELIE